MQAEVRTYRPGAEYHTVDVVIVRTYTYQTRSAVASLIDQGVVKSAR